MRLFQENTAALLIDVQDKLVPAVYRSSETVALISRLVKCLRLLEVPIIPIRQYPRGLGDFPPEIKEALGEHTASDKITFSAWGTPEIAKRVQGLGKQDLLVFGMETHVCVLQTVSDLLDNGYNVMVVADCVSARNPYDHEIALSLAGKKGATLTTSEIVLFELLKKSGSDVFRQVSALVR